MANTKENVTFGKPKVAGAIYRAVCGEGVTIPTTVSEDLDTDLKCLGYISDDGVSHNMENSDDGIKAWGGDTVLVPDVDRTDSFQFTLLEVMNEEVLKAVFVDSNVTVTAATSSAPKQIAVASNSAVQPDCVWVIDMVMQGNNPKRVVIPKGAITEIGEVVYKDDEAVGYQITVNGKADSSGNTHYEYMAIGSPTST
jgi:hypothetical protein